ELVFRFAASLAGRTRTLLVGLLMWALADGGLVYLEVAHKPAIRTVLGLAGALAVIAVSTLLQRSGRLRFVRYAAQNSLVCYLPCFIPMMSLRTIALRYEIVPDLGTLAVLVTAASVALPLLVHRLVRNGPLRFLFARPAWTRIVPAGSPRRRAGMVPAE